MQNKLLKKIKKRFKQLLKTIYMKHIRKFIRFTSYPFISGDTFRKESNHVLDEIRKINISKVNHNDRLFVKADFLDHFSEIISPKIDKKVSVIFHNSDQSFSKNDLQKFRNKKFLIFAQNLDIDLNENDNVFPLPIGIENKSYLINGKIKNFTNSMKYSSEVEKKDKILCAFNPNTNSERLIIRDIASKSLMIELLRFSGHELYLKKLAEYKFSLCPEGNGIDTHRFWESLMVETIPVVKENNLNNNFKNLGVPCLILKDWTELKNLSKNELNHYYADNLEILKKKNYIYFDFWKKFIDSKEKVFFNQP